LCNRKSLSCCNIKELPGQDNALGKGKFPNRYDIYFHDPNAIEIFNKDERAVSNGCITMNLNSAQAGTNSG
jgi:murein L,D-transpeptidase YcbB/YkuD